jgi:hypothetical protein
VVALESGVVGEGIDERESGGGAGGHGDCDGAVELDDWGGCEAVELGVEGSDAMPVGVFRGGCLSVAGGDGGLEDVGARLGAVLGDDLLREGEGGEATADKKLIPA